jgi:hypothetical protein
MVAKRRERCPEEHGWASNAPPLAWRPRKVPMPALPSSPSPCPRPASGVSGASVQRARVPVTRPLSSVRCGRLERPGVPRPGVQGWSVRCLCAPVSTVSDWEVVEGGGGTGSSTAAIAGLGVAPQCPRSALNCLNQNRAIQAGAGLLGQRRRRLGLGRRRGRRLGNGRVALVAAEEAGYARGSLVARAGRRSEVATTLRGHRVKPRVESPRP